MLRLLKAASLHEVTLAGFKFRIKRVVSFDLLPHEGNPLLAALPRNAEDLEELRCIAETTDPAQKTARSLEMARRIAERESDPDRQLERYRRDMALVKAGVEGAWDEDASAWVKVHLVDTEEEAEAAPENLWIGHIPGGRGGIAKLAEEVLRISTSVGGDAARIERFRGGS